MWRNLPITAKIGDVLLGVFILAGIIGPLLVSNSPGYENASPSLSLQPPSSSYWLGTTQSGQDVLSQLLSGIRLTLELALLVGVIATALSVIVGVTSAFLGGIWDELLMLLANVFLVIPALPLLILVFGYLPGKGQLPTIIVLSALGWQWGARVIRAQTLMIRNRDFVAASRESGEKSWRIIFFEIIPNEVSLIASSFVNTVLYAIAHLGLARLHRPRRPEQLVARHHALLGPEPAGAAARRLVVVPAPGPRGRPHRHRPGAAQHRLRRARQPPAARLPRIGQDRGQAGLGDRPDPGDPAPRRLAQPGLRVHALLLAQFAARRHPRWR